MGTPETLFRAEAVEHHVRGSLRSDILTVDPTATAWGHRLVFAALAAGVAFAILGKITEYASGPALVRLDGRVMLTAQHPALVSRVAVLPGDRVREGDVLVEFHAAEEAAELAAASREFDDQLRKLMQYPDDANAREALVALRTRKELAQKRLAQRSLRAPRGGQVGDVRVREGQFVETGMSLVEIIDEASSAHVTALLPGRYRPYLAQGKHIRFELDGFARRAEQLEIENVGEQIVGPAEAARYLGRDVADALSIEGPVVLVEATLPRASFEADGQKFVYAHGMLGKAESPVRAEPIAFVFVPALKLWLEHVQPDRWLARARPAAAQLEAWFARQRPREQMEDAWRWLEGAFQALRRRYDSFRSETPAPASTSVGSRPPAPAATQREGR